MRAKWQRAAHPTKFTSVAVAHARSVADSVPPHLRVLGVPTGYVQRGCGGGLPVGSLPGGK